MATKALFSPSVARGLPKTPISRSSKTAIYTTRTRCYHSHDHPPPPSKFTPTEAQILSSSYPLVPEYGFTLTTLAFGARKAGYVAASTNLFPKGAVSLVEWHLEVQKKALAGQAEQLWNTAEKLPGVGAKVKALIWERLMGNREIIERWQEALALLAQPSNMSLSLSTLASLSDEIWYLSGDVSVDMSWYTKRASLSTIYAATELFMTTDKSKGFTETRQFLDRRFEDSRVLGGLVGGMGEWAGFQGRAMVNVLRSKGVRI